MVGDDLRAEPRIRECVDAPLEVLEPPLEGTGASCIRLDSLPQSVFPRRQSHPDQGTDFTQPADE